MCCNGEDVVQVHLVRIAYRAYVEGRRRSRRSEDRVHSTREHGAKIIGDQRPDGLGLLVIGIIVARGEHVSAEKNSTRDLGPEPFGTSGLVHGPETLARIDAETVSHSIETGEVRRRLRGREYVIDWNRQRRPWQRDISDGCAH